MSRGMRFNQLLDLEQEAVPPFFPLKIGPVLVLLIGVCNANLCLINLLAIHCARPSCLEQQCQHCDGFSQAWCVRHERGVR